MERSVLEAHYTREVHRLDSLMRRFDRDKRAFDQITEMLLETFALPETAEVNRRSVVLLQRRGVLLKTMRSVRLEILSLSTGDTFVVWNEQT